MLGIRGACAGLAVALAAAAAAEPAPLRAVATIEPLCMLARELVAETACVALVPSGASPHAFEPRPSAMAAIARAELLLRAGNGIDDWAAPLAGERRAEWIVVGSPCERDDAACAHFWVDPLRLHDEVGGRIAAALAAALPDRAAEIEARALRFQLALERAIADAQRALAPAAGSAFVSFHPAWSGFAASFGLEDLGAIQAHGAEEPTPRRLAGLIESARSSGVRAVLVEPQLDPHVARIVAEELGAKVVRVDELGDPRDPQRASALALLRWNVSQLAAALAEPAP